MSNIFQPNEEATIKLNKSQTLSGSNATVTTAIWTLTGSVRILKLYAVVTTVLGTNHTAASYRLNDQSAQVAITSNAGTTLSNAPVGSIISKLGLAATAINFTSSANGAVVEPTTLETLDFSEFIVVKKNGATTQIEYKYTTTETPTSGVLQHFVEYEALSADGALS